jgi:sterol desaturase/sphingolipid hydroxylase (fatty acid hydroxylase superfamily)
MLTEEEKGFILYWEQNRIRKKRLLWQLAAGLPLGVFLAGAIFINYFSGWHKRADMKLWADSSGGLVIIIALLLTIVFVVVFSSHYRWDMNEQRYRELLTKKNTQ